MIFEDVEIATPDGTMNASVARPDGTGSWPGVIVYMPASGIRAELIDIASRIASLGYVTVLPNLYYRLAREVDIDANRLFDEEYAPVRDYMIGLSQNLTNQRVIADTGALLDFLDARRDVASGPKGGVGYCMGGRLVMASIGAHPDRLSAAVSMYGAGIVTDEPDSPHHALHRVGGELYFGLAENDVYVDSIETEALREHLSTLEVTKTIELYTGDRARFLFPGAILLRPQSDRSALPTHRRSLWPDPRLRGRSRPAAER